MKSSHLKNEAELRERARAFGQEHLFTWWPELNDSERNILLGQIESIDFDLIQALKKNLLEGAQETEPVDLQPAPIIRTPQTEAQKQEAREAAATGEDLLCKRQVAPLVVAGGQGTRLGFNGPKGAYPIGPVSKKCLFAIFAEKILASQKRYGKTFTWFVMTSPANDQETRAFFKKNDFFGLKEHQVFFFTQGTMPAVNTDGKILMASRCGIVLSPDGHGGTLGALVRSGALGRMEEQGILEISYFQVDNVLVKPLDPVFIGYHVRAGAEMSSKVLRKACPEEKVGVVGMRNGKVGVVEYSDLSRENMHATGPDGGLRYWAGSIAIHMLQTAFVRRLQSEGIRLPFHRANKKVPYIDLQGNTVEPQAPNGIKFECFIFDALEYARNPVTLEVVRKEEFSPVKNASGVDSPESAQRDMMALFASWLQEAGVQVPRNPDGSLAIKIEISPLFALDRQESLKKIEPPLTAHEDLYLTGP